MTTFKDDMVRIPSIVFGDVNIPLAALGLEWPPPEDLALGGLLYRRISCSQITDEQRESMTHVIRGAEYEYVGLDPDWKEPEA